MLTLIIFFFLILTLSAFYIFIKLFNYSIFNTRAAFNYTYFLNAEKISLYFLYFNACFILIVDKLLIKQILAISNYIIIIFLFLSSLFIGLILRWFINTLFNRNMTIKSVVMRCILMLPITILFYCCVYFINHGNITIHCENSDLPLSEFFYIIFSLVCVIFTTTSIDNNGISFMDGEGYKAISGSNSDSGSGSISNSEDQKPKAKIDKGKKRLIEENLDKSENKKSKLPKFKNNKSFSSIVTHKVGESSSSVTYKVGESSSSVSLIDHSKDSSFDTKTLSTIAHKPRFHSHYEKHLEYLDPVSPPSTPLANPYNNNFAYSPSRSPSYPESSSDSVSYSDASMDLENNPNSLDHSKVAPSTVANSTDSVNNSSESDNSSESGNSSSAALSRECEGLRQHAKLFTLEQIVNDGPVTAGKYPHTLIVPKDFLSGNNEELDREVRMYGERFHARYLKNIVKISDEFKEAVSFNSISNNEAIIINKELAKLYRDLFVIITSFGLPISYLSNVPLFIIKEYSAEELYVRALREKDL